LTVRPRLKGKIVTPDAVAVTLGAKFPVAVAEFVVIVNVEVFPAVDAGLNEALAPEGRPLADRFTVPVKPLRLMVIE
jgi:hypothetical protein